MLEFERTRLRNNGRDDLAEKVTRISESLGDGAGYDILSFENDGRERYVEVKTTSLGMHAPFLVSVNEVEFSEQHCEQYWLYRVFNVAKQPTLFVVRGSLRKCCLEPTQFRASVVRTETNDRTEWRGISATSERTSQEQNDGAEQETRASAAVELDQ